MGARKCVNDVPGRSRRFGAVERALVRDAFANARPRHPPRRSPARTRDRQCGRSSSRRTGRAEAARAAARSARFARDNAIAIARAVSLYFACTASQPRGHDCSSTLDFRYIAIEGTGRRREIAACRSTRIASRRDRRARRNGEPVSRRLLRRPSGRRVPGAAVLHPLAPSTADRAAAERSVQPAHGLRLPVRSGQDLRLSRTSTTTSCSSTSGCTSCSRRMCPRPTS